MGSQRRFLASHICDGSKSARRIDGRIGVTNRERETRGPKRPLGSPAELSLLPFCLSVLWPLLSSVGVLSHRLSIVLFPPWVVLSSSSSAVCRGVDQAVHFGGYGYPPWLYFEIRHQKWFTVEAVAVLAPGIPASVSSHSIGFIFIVGRPRTYVISGLDFGSRVYLRAMGVSALARRAAPASRARMPGSLNSRRWPTAPPWRRAPATSDVPICTLSSLGSRRVREEFKRPS